MTNEQLQRAAEILQELLEDAFENGLMTDSDYDSCCDFLATAHQPKEQHNV